MYVVPPLSCPQTSLAAAAQLEPHWTGQAGRATEHSTLCTTVQSTAAQESFHTTPPPPPPTTQFSTILI